MQGADCAAPGAAKQTRGRARQLLTWPSPLFAVTGHFVLLPVAPSSVYHPDRAMGLLRTTFAKPAIGAAVSASFSHTFR